MALTTMLNLVSFVLLAPISAGQLPSVTRSQGKIPLIPAAFTNMGQECQELRKALGGGRMKECSSQFLDLQSF